MLLGIECLLVVFALFLSLKVPQWSDFLKPFERALARLARKRRTSTMVVGGSALLLRLLLLPILPIPKPAVHDEFSYLLAANTFAHGRLTNPTHPMWVHFETFHEIQKPSYASMYYPAQGFFLALGQIALGHPFWGVWLSTGLMCAAICWMLQGWMAPLWALLGGLLAVIRIGTLSYWMNSYWGGSVAALGGALVLGALPRIRRRQELSDALAIGTGLVIIGLSRPYEGLFFVIPVGAILFMWFVRRWNTKGVLWMASTVLLCVMLGAAAAGLYFWCITGSPLRTPFQVNLATYNPVPYFPWQTMRPIPHYNHEVMRDFYLNWWMRQYEFGRLHPFALLLVKISVFWLFFLGFLFSFPLILALFSLPFGFSVARLSGRTRILCAVCGCVVLGSLLPVYFNPHYAAVITAALYGLLLLSMNCLRRLRINKKPVGIAIVRSVPLIALLLLLLAFVPGLRVYAAPQMATWYSPIVEDSYRADIIRQLASIPGDHLVIIHYAPNHVSKNEWVFNDADIDRSKIVWARDMGKERNAELINYFKGRGIWTLEPDTIPPALSRYSQ